MAARDLRPVGDTQVLASVSNAAASENCWTACEYRCTRWTQEGWTAGSSASQGPASVASSNLRSALTTVAVFQSASKSFAFAFPSFARASLRFAPSVSAGSNRIALVARTCSKVGTVTVDGSDLTVYRHRISTHVTNSCGNDGDRTQGAEVRHLRWSIDLDAQGLEWLSLIHDDGAVEQYRRWTE